MNFAGRPAVHAFSHYYGFFQIAGGVALIVFGVRFLRKGFERLFGGCLLDWLAGLTRQRWKAFGSGVAVGTFAPPPLLLLWSQCRSCMPAS